MQPGRELLREGVLQKISRKGVGPRYFILLSDCLLYCEFTGSGGWSTVFILNLHMTFVLQARATPRVFTSATR